VSIAAAQRICLAALGDTTVERREVVKTGAITLIQLLLPPNGSIPTYESQGEVILHCLTGEVSLQSDGQNLRLEAGELLHLAESAPFSLCSGPAGASLLVTMTAAQEGPVTELIGENFRPLRPR
jgi:hypothetical protein